MAKKMYLTCFEQRHKRGEWHNALAPEVLEALVERLARELERFGIELERRESPGGVIEVNSYGDLLNAVRIGSPADGITNLCVGHIIGKSPNLDPLEDIERAVNRIAFAPETVPPDDQNRRVCHNCGCGC